MPLDPSILHLLNDLAGRATALDQVIVFCASYLPYLTVLLFIIVAARLRYGKHTKWKILFTGLASALIARFGLAELVHAFYHRSRPFAALPGIRALLTEPSWSFPSLHATIFFALAMTVYWYHRWWGIVFFVLAFVISAARVAAGLHYPSDILGGAAVGVAAAWGTWYVARRLTAKTP